MQRLAAIVAAIALLACHDVPSAPTRTEPRAPEYSFSNGPETPGPIVFRTTDDPFFIFLNDDRAPQLVAVMRPADPTELEPCGGSNSLEPVDLQLVFHSSGAINQTLLARDITVWLYQRGPFLSTAINSGLCAAFATQVPIYTGTASLVAHDNDAFFSGNHADAFGWSAIGTVTKISDGSEYRYQNEYHGVLASDGSLLFFRSTIDLKPL